MYKNKYSNNLMDIKALVKENNELKEENALLKQKLEKYMNQHKNYYENNKVIVNEKAKQRLKKIAEENPEKIKEYRRNAYLKRKEKLKNENITEK
jgi:cell division septum initiation protein DivIVA